MNYSFKAVDYEGLSPIAKVIGDVPFNFCDFTPYVIFTWQKYYDTHFAIIDDSLVLRHNINGELCFAPLTKDVVSLCGKLLEGEQYITFSLVTGNELNSLKESFEIMDVECDAAWSDYIYQHSDISELTGKRYAGQRNHINKFVAANPDWHYETVNESNIGEVLSFYEELTSDIEGFDETALYERARLLEYFDYGFSRLPLSGGLIRAGGRIVSVAFGERIGDMLYVHIEKARKDVQGAYQMIVREFARHNPAAFINREEDMGIEGLRISKMSYHPIRLEQKYKVKVKTK